MRNIFLIKKVSMKLWYRKCIIISPYDIVTDFVFSCCNQLCWYYKVRIDSSINIHNFNQTAVGNCVNQGYQRDGTNTYYKERADVGCKSRISGVGWKARDSGELVVQINLKAVCRIPSCSAKGIKPFLSIKGISRLDEAILQRATCFTQSSLP